MAVITVALLMAALVAPAASSANVGQLIVERCGHGESLSGFSVSDYAKALKQLSATAEEYSECAQLIRQAQLAAAAGHGAPGTTTRSTGPLTATPAEQRSISRAAQAGVQPVAVGGQVIRPGVVHADVSSALSTLPTPVLALLAFLLACGLAAGAAMLRRRVRDGRHD